MTRITAACVVFFLASAACASVIIQGAVVDYEAFNAASSAPGSAFTLDYRPFIPGGAPYQLREVGFSFNDPFRPFSTVSMQLDSSPTVFTFFSIAPQHTLVDYQLYDPQITTSPGGPYPAMPAYQLLAQEWRDEAADGVISGHLWIDNTSHTLDQFALVVNSVFAVPEPSACMLAIAGALGFLRRRPRRVAG